MGGGYYEREVETAKPGESYSTKTNQIFEKNYEIHKSLDPKRFGSEPLISNYANPIVFALDVTGSMGDWTKVSPAFTLYSI